MLHPLKVYFVLNFWILRLCITLRRITIHDLNSNPQTHTDAQIYIFNSIYLYIITNNTIYLLPLQPTHPKAGNMESPKPLLIVTIQDGKLSKAALYSFFFKPIFYVQYQYIRNVQQDYFLTKQNSTLVTTRRGNGTLRAACANQARNGVAE